MWVQVLCGADKLMALPFHLSSSSLKKWEESEQEEEDQIV